MFDWFKRPKFVEQTTATDDMMLGDLPRHAPMSAPKVVPFVPKIVSPQDTTNDDAIYTIGINDAGRVQLRFNGDYGATTLTMNEAAVRSLIRQLEAALPKEEEE